MTSAPADRHEQYVLTISCPDRVGIVHTVSGFLAQRMCNIVESHQYGDPSTGRFFMRIVFDVAPSAGIGDALRVGFAPIGSAWAMNWELHDVASRPRVLVMVSRAGHCLNDLLYRWRVGALQADIAAIVSNHRDFEALAGAYAVPFHHLPVDPSNKLEQEARLLSLVDEHGIDLVVLARYMQVLSPAVCAQLAGRIINIHHSFLPSFKGARPYQQAFDRGVKLIGATAHYVTEVLDEGPIIEQEVARVDHTMSPDRLAAVGRDLESVALARAVQWHTEHRVLLDGVKTIVFR